MKRQRIGIIGAGLIGRTLHRHISQTGMAEIGFVLVRDAQAAALAQPEMAGVLLDDAEEARSLGCDLVVEAAHPDVLGALAPGFLASADVCGFSCTALADPAKEHAILEAAAASGRTFFLPHGAVLGLDGLVDGRESIAEVRITTTKSDTSLGLPKGSNGTIFEGSTRDACHRFPRNVNVHAAVALAGIGFDRTRSMIVADPGTAEMRHRIEVSGPAISWDISISSRSLGGVTGAYTPQSAIGSVGRILGLSRLHNC